MIAYGRSSEHCDSTELDYFLFLVVRKVMLLFKMLALLSSLCGFLESVRGFLSTNVGVPLINFTTFWFRVLAALCSVAIFFKCLYWFLWVGVWSAVISTSLGNRRLFFSILVTSYEELKRTRMGGKSLRIVGFEKRVTIIESVFMLEILARHFFTLSASETPSSVDTLYKIRLRER